MNEEDALLFQDTAGGAALYGQIENLILGLGDVEIRPRRTQVGFFHGPGFAWLWPARRKAERQAGKIMFSLALPYALESPRTAEIFESYPGRWMHHFYIQSMDEMDEEILAWLLEAWHFAAFRARK